jgi:hypothetical protein
LWLILLKTPASRSCAFTNALGDFLRPISPRVGNVGVESITVTLELPVSAPLSSSVRALEAARDAQSDPKAKQALAAVAALASRGLVATLAKSAAAHRRD